jgi:hypothetical protein
MRSGVGESPADIHGLAPCDNVAAPTLLWSRDVALFESRNQGSARMAYVLVNGVPVIADGKATDALPGKVLRGPGYQAGAR